MTEPNESALKLADRARTVHGAISHNAAYADLALYEVFHYYISGCDRNVSRVIYFTIDSSQGRAALVRRTAEARGADAPTLALIEELGTAVSKTIRFRNDSAHSFLDIEIDYFGHDDRVRVVNPKRVTVPFQPVTDATLTAQHDASMEHLKKVKAAFAAACQKLGIPPTITI